MNRKRYIRIDFLTQKKPCLWFYLFALSVFQELKFELLRVWHSVEIESQVKNYGMYYIQTKNIPMSQLYTILQFNLFELIQ